MKILITGGSGFIGSNLAHYLKNKHDVFIIDNLSAGSRENIKGVAFADVDIRNINNWLSPYKPDLVIHLAAINSLPYAFMNPQETYDINVYGTQEIINFCERNNSALLFAGTSAEYELTKVFPTPESEMCPESPYAISKVLGGNLVRLFYERTGIPAVHMRFFSTFGPAQDFTRDIPPVISIFFKNIHKDKKSIVYADGLKKRDYIFIDDNNTAIDTIINNLETIKYDIVNIGTGKTIEILDLYHLCERVAKKEQQNFKKTSDDLWPDPTLITQANISKLVALGWQPQVTLEKGLKHHYNWLVQQKEFLNV